MLSYDCQIRVWYKHTDQMAICHHSNYICYYEAARSELLRWREAIEQRLQMQPMRDYGGEPVYSVVCMSPTRAQLDKAMAECSEFDFVLMDDRQHDLVNAETSNRRYDKGSGVKQVCAAIGVDPADSICFGDSLNDLPMFAAAGFSVCMGNGGDAAKQSADAVCDSVEAGGLAKAFADFGLLA